MLLYQLTCLFRLLPDQSSSRSSGQRKPKPTSCDRLPLAGGHTASPSTGSSAHTLTSFSDTATGSPQPPVRAAGEFAHIAQANDPDNGFGRGRHREPRMNVETVETSTALAWDLLSLRQHRLYKALLLSAGEPPAMSEYAFCTRLSNTSDVAGKIYLAVSATDRQSLDHRSGR
jgi:hypothetical protein